MRKMLLVVAICPALIHAQSAYRCETESGHVYQDKPCDIDAAPVTVTTADFGESKRNWEVALAGTYCELSYGYITANGYVINKTNNVVQATVSTSFIGSLGSVRGNIDLPYNVPAHSRVPFSHTAKASGADSCRYQVRW